MSKNEMKIVDFLLFSLLLAFLDMCIILDFHQQPFFKEGKNQYSL